MKRSEFIKQMTEHGTQTASRTDNSPRGYSTVAVEDIKPGDNVILNNSIVTIEADEPQKPQGLYKAGIALEEDMEMCEAFDEIERNPEAVIIGHGRKVNICECKYKSAFCSDMEKTGREHLGFDFLYIIVYYNGFIWSINPATYYPFTDTNNPGRINATPYLLIDGCAKIQCGYAQPFEGLEKLQTPHRSPLKGVYKQPITYYIRDFLRIFESQAGNREKAIYNAPHVCFEVQNDNGHRVIRCAKLEREPDGVREYFEIDTIGGKITG